jgi:hypothetical protein
VAAGEDADPTNVVGDWRIARDVIDFRADVRGSFEGRLVVAADATGYVWAESGMLRWGQRTSPAMRKLRLQLMEAGWWMTFDDGRPFHPWKPNCEVVHRCGQDIYTGMIRYRTATPHQIEIAWDVTGPGKRYRLASRYRRLP